MLGSTLPSENESTMLRGFRSGAHTRKPQRRPRRHLALRPSACREAPANSKSAPKSAGVLGYERVAIARWNQATETFWELPPNPFAFKSNDVRRIST